MRSLLSSHWGAVTGMSIFLLTVAIGAIAEAL